MSKPVVGLLPLYLELYDQVVPENRQTADAFAGTIRAALEKLNIEVCAAPVCCVKPEFAKAVKSFEKKRVDAIVTLHLAYSPSLESADVLAATALPLIVLDTTPDFDFGFNTGADRIMYNHGIHGVQDMCNMLLRKGKHFMLEAGHWQQSDVLIRVAADIKACIAADAMKTARVGIIGQPFSGMGDFAIPFADLKKLIGIETVPATSAKFKAMHPAATEITEELKLYSKLFKIGKASKECLVRTAATSLTVRKWMIREKLTAFTFNFLDIDRKCGLGTVPFLEASMVMARGIGYAGEGDVLTAAFVASLAKVFPETTFSEMFCPDWKGNKVFLSHMGELNVDVISGKPELLEKTFPFFKADSPALAQGCMKSGPAALINLAPGPRDSFTMIVCFGDVRMPRKNKIAAISGWFEPDIPMKDMLSEYSCHGGTHHLALVYNPDYQILRRYAEIMGWNCVII
jgi:L-arabinose isomerase